MVGTGSVCTVDPHCNCVGFEETGGFGQTLSKSDACGVCGHQRQNHHYTGSYADDLMYIDFYYTPYYVGPLPDSTPISAPAVHHQLDAQPAPDMGPVNHPNGPAFDDALANHHADAAPMPDTPSYQHGMDVASGPDHGGDLTQADFDIRVIEHHSCCCCE
jgi:hypothetical protein